MKVFRRSTRRLVPATAVGLLGIMLLVQPDVGYARTRTGISLGDPDTGDNGAKPNTSSALYVAHSTNTKASQDSVQTKSSSRPRPEWIWVLIYRGLILP